MDNVILWQNDKQAINANNVWQENFEHNSWWGYDNVSNIWLYALLPITMVVISIFCVQNYLTGLCVFPLAQNDDHQVGTDIPNGDSVGVNFSRINSENESMCYFALLSISHINCIVMT